VARVERDLLVTHPAEADQALVDLKAHHRSSN
jgi:hypothetical protein